MTTPEEQLVLLKDLDERYLSLRLARPERLGMVLRSVRQHGVLHPILVNRNGDGALVVLDGFKRLRVLRELGQSEVRAQVVCLGESEARAAMLTYNGSHAAGLCELEEAWIVHSLVRQCQLRQKDVAALLGRDKSWVCRRLALAEQLSSSVQDDMRLGLVNASVAREVVRLPRGNQDVTVEAIRTHGLTSRQAGELVSRILSASDDAAAEAVLADPLRFLEPAAAPTRASTSDPRLSPGGEEIRRGLVRLDQAVAGLQNALGRHPLLRLRPSDREVLAAAAAEASQRARRLSGVLDAWPSDTEEAIHA